MKLLCNVYSVLILFNRIQNVYFSIYYLSKILYKLSMIIIAVTYLYVNYAFIVLLM